MTCFKSNTLCVVQLAMIYELYAQWQSHPWECTVAPLQNTIIQMMIWTTKHKCLTYSQLFDTKQNKNIGCTSLNKGKGW